MKTVTSHETAEAYVRDIERLRAEKDHALKTDPASPIEVEDFTGLSYFEVSPEWRVEATLEPFDTPDVTQDVVHLTTSAGDTKSYYRVGRARFSLAGQTCALTLYRPTFVTASEHLFVPFRDATSGSETYGAGRYLEASLQADGRVLLDFNRCYHPYCAYSGRYRCPLPPAENQLEVAVRAGEKL